jgi:histidinol-phosphate aminotransferase
VKRSIPNRNHQRLATLALRVYRLAKDGDAAMALPPVTEIVGRLPDSIPFVGPETLERRRGNPFQARLGANESGFGPAPSVIAAMAEAAPMMWQYCDPENFELRRALADHYGLLPENFTIDRGIDGLLECTCRQYVAPGTAVVTSLGAYPTFNYHVAVCGGALITVPFDGDDREDLDALLDAVERQGARMVYVSNPDNPMGTWWSADAIMAMQARLPEDCLLILDEAYGETAPVAALPPIGWMKSNVVRMRTFSKAYGLAGLRCGYAFGDPELMSRYNKVRNQYGMTKMAQVACQAALHDQDWLAQVVGQVAACRDRIAAIARNNGLTPIASATNFVTIDCGRDAPHAGAILGGLADRNVFIRKPMAPGLDRCIRVSCGPEGEIDLFEAALARVLGELA